MMASSSVTSAAKVRNVVFGWAFARFSEAALRLDSLLPRRAMVAAPATAKLLEISKPMPVAPPLIKTVLPDADRVGRDGSIAG